MLKLWFGTLSSMRSIRLAVASLLRGRLVRRLSDKYPITTMPWAVRVYERIRARNAVRGLAGPEDYVFMPDFEAKQRDGASSDMLKLARNARTGP